MLEKIINFHATVYKTRLSYPFRIDTEIKRGRETFYNLLILISDLSQVSSSKGYISAGECTNCERCITVCPEDTLQFDLKLWINQNDQQNPSAIEAENLTETDPRRKAA